MKIKKLAGLQILDSRGTPTIECHLWLDDDTEIIASVPSGASVGAHEALELRDGDKKHYAGMGVKKAIKNLDDIIAPALIKKKPDLLKAEKLMAELDGSANKSVLGANTMLAVSIAIARAQAHIEKMPLYQLLNKLYACKEIESLPLPLLNLINGGVHAKSGLAFQELLIIPQAQSFEDNLENADMIFTVLAALLAEQDLSTAVGDEGGYAPKFKGKGLEKERFALALLQEAIETAGDEAAESLIALDVAATQFYDADTEKYKLHGKDLTSKQLVDLYAEFAAEYGIVSIEDGLAEDDWDGWLALNKKLGESMQLVGDDLFATNPARIKQGIKQQLANAVLIKPNQIGSIGEAVLAVKLAQEADLNVIVSHRSGETNDDFIADFAVAVGADQFKAGAPNRGERVAKYNRLLDIAEGF